MGGIEGKARLAGASCDPADAVPQVDIVLITLGAFAHEEIIRLCDPFLSRRTALALEVDPTLGAGHLSYSRESFAHGAVAKRALCIGKMIDSDQEVAASE